MPPDTPAISVAGLTKRFGRRLAVDNLSFDVPPGVVGGFIGPNGAGKSTTLAMLLGLVRPTSGSAAVLGHDIREPRSYLRRVGAMIEGPAFYRSLSGHQNLELIAGAAQHDRGRISGLLDRVGLLDRGDDRYRAYSTGMKQRLGIAAALLGDPDLLLLDEPTNGLDPVGIAEMRVLLRDLATAERSLLVSSHALGELEQVCDWLVVIDHGRCLFQGPAHELLAASGVRVLVAPEHDRDLPRLQQLLAETGHSVESRIGHLVVEVDRDDPAAVAAAIARDAARGQIVLTRLETSSASLEDSYLAMVLADSEGVDS